MTGAGPPTKRARVDVHMRHLHSNPRQTVYGGDGLVGSRTSSSEVAPPHEHTAISASAEANHNTPTMAFWMCPDILPAAEALASIQRIEPLIDDGNRDRLDAYWAMKTGKERGAVERSCTARITSLSEEEEEEEECDGEDEVSEDAGGSDE